MRRFFVVAVLVLAFLGLGCNQQSHTLLRVESDVLYVEVGDAYIEPRLSAFFACRNEEEYVGFYTMKIVNKETGAVWNVRRDQLSFFKVQRNGSEQFLVGTNKLVFPKSSVLAGQYDLSVFELNMAKTKASFSLPEGKNYSEFPVKANVSNTTASFDTAMTVTNTYCLLLGVDREPFLVTKYNALPTLNIKSILEENPDTHSLQFVFESNGEKFLSRIFELDTNTSEDEGETGTTGSSDAENMDSDDAEGDSEGETTDSMDAEGADL